MPSGIPSSPPPPYVSIDGSNRGDGPSPAADEGQAEKRKSSLAQRILGLLRTTTTKTGQNRRQAQILTTKDLEILVHETGPNIREVVAHRCSERTRRVIVEVQVSASVTARSRQHVEGRPAVSTYATWEVNRTAQAHFTTREEYWNI